MTEQISNQQHIEGLLPHEQEYTLRSLGDAALSKASADLAYGEAVLNSGGDWAFDDAGSQATAEIAHIADMRVKLRKSLAELPSREYPAQESEWVGVGSRVTVLMKWGEDVYDISSRRIPEMPIETDVEMLSAGSPLGAALIGKKTGDTVEWTTPLGMLSGVVIKLDQVAQKHFYEQLKDAE